MASLNLALSSAITLAHNFDDILALARPFNANSGETIPQTS